MESSRIWVSGSRGFIGKYLVRALQTSSDDITCVTCRQTSDDNVIYIDCSDKRHIREIINRYGVPDVFIHLGWGSVYEPQSDVHSTSNISNSKNLISELFCAGLEKFIFLGSSSEYGDREGPLSENTEPSGKLTNYVKGKLEVASYGFEMAKLFEKVFVHLRLFYAFGAGQHQNSLINQLYRSHLGNTSLNLSPCQHFRDYIHISDVVEGIGRISSINESAIVNLGSGRAIMLRDFIELFWNCLGGNPDLLHFGAHPKPEHEPQQPYCYANLDTLRRLTGWTPSLSLIEGIKETLHTLSKSSTSSI